MIRRLDFRHFDPADASDLERLDPVVDHLRRGGLIACPTETVYGFGSTIDPGAVERVRGLKRRPDAKPVLALVAGADSVPFLRWTDASRELADLFWPGALTLILGDPERRVPPGVRSESGGVAVRHTPHPLAGALVERLGAPLTSSSANVPGEPPASRGSEVAATLEALAPDAEVWVLDAGTLPPSAPSTLVDCTGAEPVVLRQGSIPIERLRCALPEISDANRP